MGEADMTKRYVQQWLPGFAPAAEQPTLPGFPGNDDIEPSESDVETAPEGGRR